MLFLHDLGADSTCPAFAIFLSALFFILRFILVLFNLGQKLCLSIKEADQDQFSTCGLNTCPYGSHTESNQGIRKRVTRTKRQLLPCAFCSTASVDGKRNLDHSAWAMLSLKPEKIDYDTGTVSPLTDAAITNEQVFGIRKRTTTSHFCKLMFQPVINFAFFLHYIWKSY